MKEYQNLFSRSISEEEVERMLNEEEARLRAKAKKREDEIIQLIQDQEEDYFIPFETDDVEETVFSDNWLSALELRLDAEKALAKHWKDDLSLFQLWMLSDWSIEEMCEKAELPLKSTKRKIQMMLDTVRASYGLISWDETAPTTIKSKPHRRRIAGKTVKDVSEHKIYLTDEERTMPLDKLHAYLVEKGHNVSRYTIWLAKKSGYFVSQKGRDWRSKYAKQLAMEKADRVVYLSAEEKRLQTVDIASRRGISRKTAIKAKKQGFFLITKDNRDKVVVGNIPLSSEEKILLDLPEKVFEICGYKISEMKHWKDLVYFFPWIKRTTARRMISRGYINTVCLHRPVKSKFARRLKELQVSEYPSETQS